jgi:cyclic pyranopterin phosphate synthase
MVDVTSKEVTVRTATASCSVLMTRETRDLVTKRALPKGDALETARIAGIMAAKKTADLIPLCHPISLGAVEVELEGSESGIAIRATVRTADRTGVEMEALTAAAVAALTVYDMIKGIERGAEISGLRLEAKSGGRSGDYRASS